MPAFDGCSFFLKMLRKRFFTFVIIIIYSKRKEGIEVIPNVRWNDERTYLFCFDGVEKNKTVAIGTHGCIKKKDDKEYFKKGLAQMVNRLSPQNIIVYGAAPDTIFKLYKDMGINIIPFESDFSKSRKQVIA